MENAPKSHEALVNSLLSSPEDGKAQNDLLDAMYQRPDFNQLRRLLDANNEQAVLAGLFVLSELGERATAQLGLVRRLLTTQSVRVRARLAEIIGICAARAEVADLAALLSWLDADEVGLVRAATRALLMFDPRALALVDVRGGRRSSALLAVLAGGEFDKRSEADEIVWAAGKLLSGKRQEVIATGSEAGRRITEAWDRLQASR